MRAIGHRGRGLESAPVEVERTGEVAAQKRYVTEVAQHALLRSVVLRSLGKRQRLPQVLFREVELAERVISLADAAQQSAFAVLVDARASEIERAGEDAERNLGVAAQQVRRAEVLERGGPAAEQLAVGHDREHLLQGCDRAREPAFL